MCNLIRWSGVSLLSLARAAFGAPLLARVMLLLAAMGFNHVAIASQPLLGAQTVVGGAYHNCAIVNGGVQCWGYNPLSEVRRLSSEFFIAFMQETNSCNHV